MNVLLRSAIAIALFALAPSSFAQEPFDVSDRATRVVMVQVENSADPAVIGQSFGAPVSATYYVQGNTGHIVLSPASHGELRLGGSTTASANFPQLDLEIDLATLEVSSQPQTTWSHIRFNDYFGTTASIQQHGMSTDAAAGIILPDFSYSYCPNQAYIDQQCSDEGLFCGQTCTPLGLPYDPDTGLVNLVGSETRQTCARCCCTPLYESFTTHGDFLITELDSLSGLPNRPLAVIPVALIVALIAGIVLFRMRAVAKYLPCLIAAAFFVVDAAASAQEPLDLSNQTARTVWVHFEESSDPTVIGQTFGPPFPATYWVEGNTGKLQVASTWHRQLRMGGYTSDYSVSASALQFEIDLTTLEASSRLATARLVIMRGAGIFYTTAMTQSALGTNTPAGLISGSHTTRFCPDQAYVDQLCSEDSDYCGETCTPISGLPYDPDTGLVNLVGSERNQTCDRCCCGPQLSYPATLGDLMLTEVAEAPGLPNRPLAVIPVALIMAFIAGATLIRMRSAPR